MDIKEIRAASGKSRADFAREYGIPIRTMEDWEADRRQPPKYLTELLGRAVLEDKKMLELKGYDDNVLRELGLIYQKLLYILNSRGNDPYPYSDTFPVKCFTMVYMRAVSLHIPKELQDRIMLLLNSVNAEDWIGSMDVACPMSKRIHFQLGMMDASASKK